MVGRGRLCGFYVCAVLALCACTSHRMLFITTDSGPLQVGGNFKPASVSPINPRRPLYVAVEDYQDDRDNAPSRQIGEIKDTFVSDMTGNKIEIDEDVAAVVTSAMKKQMAAYGYRVVDGTDAHAPAADFVIKGRIEKFSYDVISRDKVNMVVQTIVSNPRENTVIWSGTVTEHSDRFAGVTGNSRGSIIAYFDKSLQNLVRKTADAFTASLVQAQPDMFLQAGTPTPGVTVETAPSPAAEASAGAKTAGEPGSKTGVLSVTTTPAAVQVYIGDVYYGLSPLRLQLAPGVYPVRLVADGYREVEQKVSVRAAQTTAWDVNMHK